MADHCQQCFTYRRDGSDNMKQEATREGANRAAGMVLSFFISLLIFLLCNTLVFSLTLGSSRTVTQAMLRSHYYDNLTAELRAKLYEYGDVSGLPHSLFDSIVSTQRVMSDSHNYISAALLGRTDAPDNAALSLNFQQAIYQYSDKAKAQKNDPSFQKNVKSFADQCAALYSSGIAITGLPSAGRALVRLKSMALILAVVLAVLTLVLTIVLYVIQTWKHRFVRYLSYAFSGSAVMLLVIPLFIWANGIIMRVGITSRALFLLCRELFSSVLTGQLICVGTLAALFLLTLLILHRITHGAAHTHHLPPQM